MADTTFAIQPGVAYTFEFFNYKGQQSQRVVLARGTHWGMTAWHKETQFFLDAFDLEKKEVRQFPFKNIQINTFRRYTDEEVDVFLTQQEQEAENRGYNKAVEEAKASVAAQTDG